MDTKGEGLELTVSEGFVNLMEYPSVWHPASCESYGALPPNAPLSTPLADHGRAAPTRSQFGHCPRLRLRNLAQQPLEPDLAPRPQQKWSG